MTQDDMYMKIAQLYAIRSKAIRAKVGAVLVTEVGVVIPGYNGTPSGTDNACESIDPETGEIITKPEVIHAELNCILKAAKEGVSCVNSTVYVTLAPCMQCSSMLKQAGVKNVFYRKSYRDMRGVEYLRSNGVNVEKI